MTPIRSPPKDVPFEAYDVTQTGGKYLCGMLRCVLAECDSVATGELSACLDVSRASVTEMVEKFSEEGLVDHEYYKGATLTVDGEALARHLHWRRCVIEHFFENELELSIDADRAYRIGYEFPAVGIDGLAERLAHPCDEQCQAEAVADCPRLTISET